MFHGSDEAFCFEIFVDSVEDFDVEGGAYLNQPGPYSGGLCAIDTLQDKSLIASKAGIAVERKVRTETE